MTQQHSLTSSIKIFPGDQQTQQTVEPCSNYKHLGHLCLEWLTPPYWLRSCLNSIRNPSRQWPQYPSNSVLLLESAVHTAVMGMDMHGYQSIIAHHDSQVLCLNIWLCETTYSQTQPHCKPAVNKDVCHRPSRIGY